MTSLFENSAFDSMLATRWRRHTYPTSFFNELFCRLIGLFHDVRVHFDLVNGERAEERPQEVAPPAARQEALKFEAEFVKTKPAEYVCVCVEV